MQSCLHLFNTSCRITSFALAAFCSLVSTHLSALPYISEIHYDNSGADTGEAIEISGVPGESIEGWQIVLYNGSTGAVYNTRNLSGNLSNIESCEEGSVVELISGIQNGSPDGIALVNAEGSVEEFISYEGSFTASNGPAAGLTSIDIGASEGSSTSIGSSLQKTDGVWAGPIPNTFDTCADDDNDDPEIVFIHDVQGNGSSVAITSVVTVEAIVVGDFQTNNQLRGFFIQEEDSDADTNNSTSEGIFVFCSSCSTDVNVGDLVRVTGLPNDFFGMSQITATFESDIEVLDSQQNLPSAATIQLPLSISSTILTTATDEINEIYERYEGMLVSFDGTLKVSESFQLSRFGQLTLSSGDRLRQFTDYALPSVIGLEQHQIDLATRSIILDDDNNSQNAALFNATPIFHPHPGFSVNNFVRHGDEVTDLTGVLHWSWAGFSGTDAWRIRPVNEVSTTSFTRTNPRTTAPENMGGDIKVASFNVLNYFTTLDTGIASCGPLGNMDCRGANSSVELERQTQKIVSALCALDADIVGLMEIENPQLTATGSALSTLANEVNRACPPYVAIETGTVGTDAITVAFMYRPTKIEIVGSTAILDSEAFTDPANTGQSKNRPAIAQSFKDLFSEVIFTVAVNHLKSKGSSCGPGDDSPETGQGNCNGTRTLAAQVQANWLATNPTGVSTDNILIIGDLNAYRNEDPISALKMAGYTDLVDLFGGEDAYGYVFDGQLGYLDHALASQNLLSMISGVSEWHINSDEVNLLDYNDTVLDSGEASFEAKPAALPLFASDAYRSSDHDPVVIGINFPNAPGCFGMSATIYVENGIIIGGPQDGEIYTGLLLGTEGNDIIVGTSQSDDIESYSGNDFICALEGNDIVSAGDGHDNVDGGKGDDQLFGENGNDSLYGIIGNDKINGGKGEDECQGTEEAKITQCEK